MQGTPAVGNLTFRANRYPLDFAGFAGHDLTPGDPIELYVIDTPIIAAAGAPFRLEQNRPNPMREETSFVFSLDATAEVHLDVFNVAGRRVQAIVSSRLPAGQHRYEWRPSKRVSAGVYHYTLRVKGQRQSRLLVVVR